jgi:urease accessory protein
MVALRAGALAMSVETPSRTLSDRCMVEGPRTWRGSLTHALDTDGLARFDARGTLAFSGGGSALSVLRQQAPIRFLQPYPEVGDPRTGVIVNTAGGIVGGDRLDIAISAHDGAQALMTAQAAEKIYRSNGATAEIAMTFESRRGAALEVLPQGTILFDGARLRRRTALRVDADATLLFGEILHFGRVAMGETYATGAIDDRIDVTWGKRRVWVDALRLHGGQIMAMRAVSGLAGMPHAAVLVLLTPEPGRYLAGLRDVLDAHAHEGLRSGAAVFADGPLVARWLAHDSGALRRSFAAAWRGLRSESLDRPARMPRIWSI